MPESVGSNQFVAWLKEIARRWRSKWEEARIYEANPDPNRPKYFLTAAFMYPNGPAHVGHARTYIIPDVLARFKRGLGYNVLFPMGFHYTGTPILTTAEKISEGDKDYLRMLSRAFEVPEEEIAKLTEPIKLAKYFHTLSKEAMKEYGLSIDWRREFTTIDPEFNSFIRWQFTKLKEKGYLTKGSHPVGWCPKHNMPVGMHDTKDDVEPEIGELTLIKFVDDEGLKYPTATLRPETVLGVTNVWVNPEVSYCISRVNDAGVIEEWVTSCEAARRLSYQKEVRVLKEIKGSELVGKELINPVLGVKVPILEASFVSPKFGTGVVMSVPAHAPYDYVALRDYLRKEDPEEWGGFRPITLIKVEGYGKYPAKDSIERLGVRTQLDRELLDKATKEVYRDEHAKGSMIKGLSNLVREEVIKGAKEFISLRIEGKPVKEARELIKEFLTRNRYGSIMYEILNAPVYCRCGTEIVVKVVHNQWFIDYGNPEWKKLAYEALSQMRVIPLEARRQFEATIEWLKAKACARSRGLGTELPWAKGWIIESLSDSTIYMAFYTVIHKIRKYGIPPEKLTTEFWDYVMLGAGEPNGLSRRLGVSEEALKDIRDEFNYWYPLDSRHSGKDLIPNHLTFFIFNHAAIFPKDKWPKQVVANGWVLIKGEKMSKSKGNVRTLPALVRTYSPDAVRLALSVEAEVGLDMSLDFEMMGKIYDALRKVKAQVNRLVTDAVSDERRLEDKWLISKVARHILKAYEELEAVKVRAAGVRLYYLIPQEIDKYFDMVEEPSRAVKAIIDPWLKAMSAYTPYFAEEMWHSLGHDSLIAGERWATPKELMELVSSEAELVVEYATRLINDLRKVTQVVNGDGAVIYVRPKEDFRHIVKVKEIIDSGGKIGDVIRYVINEVPSVPKKKAPRVAKALLDLTSSLDSHIIEALKKLNGLDEAQAINELKQYIERKAGIKIINVYLSTDGKAPDLGGRKQQALPWKPGIYIVNNS